MKKTTRVVLSTFVLALIVQPVMALDIVVNPNSSVYFYDQQVLGDSDDQEHQQEKEDKHQEDKDEHKQEDTAKHEQEKAKERAKEQAKAEQKRSETKPIKILQQSSKTQLKVKTHENKLEVKIEDKQDKSASKSSKPSTFNNQQVMEVDKVRLELPAENDVEDEVETEDETDHDGEKTLERREAEKERQSRKNEKFEIQSETHDDGSVEFQFESRDVKAKLKGAEFVVDPETNNVMLTTPSGNTHTLVHLPDQAIQQMLKAGVITSPESSASADVKLEVEDDGSVVYKLKHKKPKKFLGLIPVEVETEVALNDQTGEVEEEEVRSDSLFGRIVNLLSR